MYIISLLALFQCPVCSVQIYIMRVISMSSNTGGEGGRVSLKLTWTPPHLCRHRHHWHDKLSQAFLLFLCILQAIWMVGGPWNEAIPTERSYSHWTRLFPVNEAISSERGYSHWTRVFPLNESIPVNKAISSVHLALKSSILNPQLHTYCMWWNFYSDNFVKAKKKKLATKLSWLTIEWCATY